MSESIKTVKSVDIKLLMDEMNNSACAGSFYMVYVKRALDLMLSALLLALISPLFLVLTVIVRLTSGSPVIFRQERLGVGGKPFTLYKFRSMRLDAEKDGPIWAEKEDDRTTPTGRFLRKYHLDELPQLVNILRGDMSFVGPRPERGFFYDKFEREVPGFHDRLAVKPGLTGLAQINGGYDINPSEKLRYDREYIRSVSFLTDAVIMLKTVGVVFGGKGAR